ncbi:unnamed protein product, partial [Discosporangium mesarthrocarpum]
MVPQPRARASPPKPWERGVNSSHEPQAPSISGAPTVANGGLNASSSAGLGSDLWGVQPRVQTQSSVAASQVRQNATGVVTGPGVGARQSPGQGQGQGLGHGSGVRNRAGTVT